MDPRAGSEPLRALQQEVASLKAENREIHTRFSRLERAIYALKILQDSLGTITPESDPFALVSKILSLALEAVDSETGSLILRDDESGELVFAGVFGPYREELQGYRLPPGEGIVGWVVDNRTAQLVPDVQHDPRFSPMVDEAIGFQTTSLVCVPLISADRVLGALEVVNPRSERDFSDIDLNILQLFARLAVEAVTRAEHQDASDTTEAENG